MDTKTLIEKTKTMIEARPGYHYSPKVLEETIEAGLKDGEIVSKGPKARLVVNGETIEAQKKDEGGEWVTVNKTPLADGHDNLLMAKAYMACQLSHSMGRIG